MTMHWGKIVESRRHECVGHWCDDDDDGVMDGRASNKDESDARRRGAGDAKVGLGTCPGMPPPDLSSRSRMSSSRAQHLVTERLDDERGTSAEGFVTVVVTKRGRGCGRLKACDKIRTFLGMSNHTWQLLPGPEPKANPPSSSPRYCSLTPLLLLLLLLLLQVPPSIVFAVLSPATVGQSPGQRRGHRARCSMISSAKSLRLQIVVGQGKEGAVVAPRMHQNTTCWRGRGRRWRWTGSGIGEGRRSPIAG
jgi:hypothetical protein